MVSQILVIDDDAAVREALRLSLTELSCTVECEADGARGLLRALEGDFSLIIVDVSLPSMNGLDVCRKLRESKPGVPILMVTSRASEIDIVLGLEQGADDYITKPFRMMELIARVRALLRRAERQHSTLPSGSESTARLSFGSVVIEPDARIVKVAGSEVTLTALEFDLLLYFALRQNRTITREQLMEGVWGYLAEDIDGSINTVLSRLRKKLGAAGKELFTTIRGFGYRFTPPEG